MRSCLSFGAALVLVTLTACQSYYLGNEESPHYAVPPGTRLLLKQPITIAPEQVGVWLQDGQAMPYSGVRVYYPHCKFESRRRLSTAQSITPDEFIVTRVSRTMTQAVRAPSEGPGVYASLALHADMSSDGPSVQAFITQMDLGSDRQPDIMRLTCGQWGFLHDGVHVTINEMRHALGNVFELRLPPKSP